MKLIVDKSQRLAKMRSHSATHLLHAVLGKIFPDTRQAGSLVDNDLLRFDFYAERLLTEAELALIQKRVNHMIYMAAKISTEEMSVEDAKQLGAKMFFEEKYGDVVRVVKIENPELPTDLLKDDNADYFTQYGDFLSLELCGGTHVDSTDQIWAFTIVSQEAVASGIKRITALTGPRVNEKFEQLSWILEKLTKDLQVKSFAQLPEKVLKLTKELTEIKSQLEAIESQMLSSLLQNGEYIQYDDLDVVMCLPSTVNFKQLMGLAKQHFLAKNMLFYTLEGIFLLLANENSDAKALMQKLGLKGGWNTQQVQWRDLQVVDVFVV